MRIYKWWPRNWRRKSQIRLDLEVGSEGRKTKREKEGLVLDFRRICHLACFCERLGGIAQGPGNGHRKMTELSSHNHVNTGTGSVIMMFPEQEFIIYL